MKLKRLGTLLLTAIIAATTLAGCGAMPSTGNGNETGENASVIAATEEDTDGQITLRVVDWSDGSATQREEFHKKFEEAHPDIKIEYTMLTVDQFKNTIVQGIISQSITDYDSALKTLANDTTTEWKRASEAVGMDYSSLEFPNWDATKDYTDADYETLK